METTGGFLISRIKQTGTRIFDRMLATSGIESFNGAQGRILYVLWQNDDISISSLAAQTSLANTTLTAMLDRMENSGLIVRKPDPKDRRNRLIALTEKAKSLQRYKEIVEVTGGRLVPEWMEVDMENLKGTIKNFPTREMIDAPVDEMLIVELYSK